MAILVTPETKILVQGITGDFGGRHARLSLDYGTQVVAGVTPGKGGQFFEHGAHKVPIFNSVAEAARHRRHGLGHLRAARPSRPTPSSSASTPAWTWWSRSPRASPSRTWSG
jgi:succinyl-CoA synthetase alpha subunit